MHHPDRHHEFDRLTRGQQERLFLDVLEKPDHATRGTWSEWFHAWLEDQSAEGRSLGEIAKRFDLPPYDDGIGDAWELLVRHVRWMVASGHARVVRIEVIT